MPLIEVSIAQGALTDEQKQKLANSYSDLMVQEISGLEKEPISVIFHEIPADSWVIGGTPLKEIIERAGREQQSS